METLYKYLVHYFFIMRRKYLNNNISQIFTKYYNFSNAVWAVYNRRRKSFYYLIEKNDQFTLAHSFLDFS